MSKSRFHHFPVLGRLSVAISAAVRDADDSKPGKIIMRKLLFGLCLASLLHSSLIVESAVGSELRVTTFSVDITPPSGQPVGLGFIPILKTTEHPLLARGILLPDAGVTCVVCTLDWMEVHNESYDFLREAIGKVAGVPESRVALHCLHQHTAPAMSTAAQRLQLDQSDPQRIASAEYLIIVSEKIAAAISESHQRWQPVTHIVARARQRSNVSRRIGASSVPTDRFRDAAATQSRPHNYGSWKKV